MSVIVEAFRIKPFDLEPIYDTWPSAPIFQGNLSRDLPVDEWLQLIKDGAKQRRVPKEYWHKVAQHYLGPRAKARFDELKAVMKNMHGGRYSWNWKRFKVAMRNMGWDIDPTKTEEIKVQSKPSGLWWIVGRAKSESSEDKDSDSCSTDSRYSTVSSSVNKELPSVPSSMMSDSPRPTPKKAMSWDFSSFKSFPKPKRSSTMSTVETISSISGPSCSSSSSSFSTSSSARSKPNTSLAATPVTTPDTTPASTPGQTTTTVAHAPVWLVNASQALSFLTTEHPKAMTAISAVLITIGSIPAMPAIAAGAGGAFLASGTAHAIGSIAVGVGSLLKTISDASSSGPNQPSQQPVQETAKT
ncbi:hypothetical protein EW026_g5879 [Hermanssonia centrifuga]|uniref:Uncharacterized protein n=1 Tax=Hermanssonia centrifuga TaxID=98765 RepID=A0A4S4KCT5_9APHY|nr:hypothetical protein EW026_g5879 [Hermanssonia centrifuga]